MRRARTTLTLFFFADGFLVASWATRVPAVKSAHALSDARLGIVLFSIAAGALVVIPTTAWLAQRVGSLRALAAAALNVTAVAVIAAVPGAGVGALAAGAGIWAGAHLALAGAAIAVGLAIAAPGLVLPAENGAPEPPPPARPRRPLLALGTIAFCCLLAEGAAADWSAAGRRSPAPDSARRCSCARPSPPSWAGRSSARDSPPSSRSPSEPPGEPPPALHRRA